MVDFFRRFLDKTPQDESRNEQIKELEQIPEAIRAQVMSGEDCDQLSNASGEFGHARMNPIPVNSIVGELKYLNRLRCACGSGLIFHRLGSVEVAGIPGNVDVFETVCLKGKHWDILYLHLYHRRRSTCSPKGYSFADFHPIFSKTPWGYGTDRKVDAFPFGLSELIAMHIGGTLGSRFASKYEEFVRNKALFRRPEQHADKIKKLESITPHLLQRPGPVRSAHQADRGLFHRGTSTKVGDYIGGEYRIHQILGGEGKSGMGIVFVCQQRYQNIHALKTFQDGFLNSSSKEQFRSEALAWIRLGKHPHIVRAHGLLELDNRLFIDLEFIAPDEEGRNTLSHYLQKPISDRQVLLWSIQFCNGMEHAMACGVFPHRDIKPDNIMITTSGTVKIADFGLAKLGGETEKQTITGTAPWMAPEQFEGKADIRSDIYSFGVVLYQMLNGGRPPFVANNLQDYYKAHKSQKIQQLNAEIFPLIKRCLSKEPGDRYANFRELRSDIEDLVKKRPGYAPTISPVVSELEAWEHFNAGVSYDVLGLSSEAIREYKEAIRINKDLAAAYGNLGIVLYKQGLFNEAVMHLHVFIKIAPIEEYAKHIKHAERLLLNINSDSNPEYTRDRICSYVYELAKQKGKLVCQECGEAAEFYGVGGVCHRCKSPYKSADKRKQLLLCMEYLYYFINNWDECLREETRENILSQLQIGLGALRSLDDMISEDFLNELSASLTNLRKIGGNEVGGTITIDGSNQKIGIEMLAHPSQGTSELFGAIVLSMTFILKCASE